MILKDVSITIGGTDLSSSCRGLTMTEGTEQQAAEAHGDDWRWFENGMRTGGAAVQLWQDYSSGGVDDTISGYSGTPQVVVVMPTSASVGAGNPTFTFTANVENYERFTGEVGDRAVCSVDLVLGASTGIVRATA